MNIALVSLGCPKNQADADVFCRALLEDGHTTVPSLEQADVAIINTCGFIDSAKEEAIENILAACATRKENPALKVVVTGCLAERYREEIAKEIPEVDAIVGIGSNAKLPEIVRSLYKADSAPSALQSYGAKIDLPLGGRRVISTPGHYAWLKIAEGCSNACSYCAIPHIRGPLRSRPLEDCVQEARWLEDQGVKELVLVAQDVTAYGDDRGENQIAALLDALNGIEGLHWIRILYAYPERITKEFLAAMARNSKVVPYLDLPIQHINNEILASMRRRGDSAAIQSAVQMIREALPEVTLRTTLIAGYPGETEKQFQELLQFVKTAQFDRLGCFAYSPEEGTLAATLPDQIVDEIKQQRVDAIMEAQSRVMARKQQSKIGKTVEIVCDEYDSERELWMCRMASDAPEIDGNVLLPGDMPLQEGNFYTATITDTDVYDLYATLTE